MSDEWQTFEQQTNDGFQSAAGWSTVGQRRPVSRGKHCKGNNDTCKAYRKGGSDFCAGHARAVEAAK